MCNLYRMKSRLEEAAGVFKAQAATGANFGEEVYPGYPGLVIAEGVARSMTWGFPLPQKSKKTGLPIKPKAVNNAREDKLLTPMWKASFEKRRCLIPVTQWAEAEGQAGRMTRTWYSLHGVDLFAVAGIWRWSEEWAEVYSMVMVDGCAQMADTHDRMPVVLRPDQYDIWTDGTPEEALALARTCDDTLAVERSTDPWFKPRRSPEAGSLS